LSLPLSVAPEFQGGKTRRGPKDKMPACLPAATADAAGNEKASIPVRDGSFLFCPIRRNLLSLLFFFFYFFDGLFFFQGLGGLFLERFFGVLTFTHD
jgi:hypothetical protein